MLYISGYKSQPWKAYLATMTWLNIFSFEPANCPREVSELDDISNIFQISFAK
jgi:hypothetical protein